MPLPCWPILPPKIATALSHPARLANHAAHRIWHHAFHRSILHAAARPIRAARTACNALPQWLLHAVAVLPVVLSLHAATPGQNALSSRQTPPSSTEPDSDPPTADPGAIPSASVVTPNDPGSSIISFAPSVPPPPPDPAAILAPYIVKSPGGSTRGPGSPQTQSGGHPSDLPPTVTGATGGDKPQPIPEPSTWLVLALPVVGLVLAKRQRLIAMCRRR